MTWGVNRLLRRSPPPRPPAGHLQLTSIVTKFVGNHYQLTSRSHHHTDVQLRSANNSCHAGTQFALRNISETCRAAGVRTASGLQRQTISVYYYTLSDMMLHGEYRFIDLFAGLGGFHQALKALGHQCVFACEIDQELADLYEKNFGFRPHGDIRPLDISAVPDHDILCAGLPCQPFSKAGDQQGLDCPQWGNLIDYVIRILRTRKPRFFIIENVPNLVRHRQGKTWRSIRHRLRSAGYSVQAKRLSPNQFGVPQIRERTFIVGRRGGLKGLVWPEGNTHPHISVRSILDANPDDAKNLPETFITYLSAWQKFLALFPKDEKMPSFPIWAMEFGATYPYTKASPAGVGYTHLNNFHGSFGHSLDSLPEHAIIKCLPPYARGTAKRFPNWKITYIRQNRNLYKRHKSWIDRWLPSISKFPPSFQKFEWNCQGEERSIWDYIIQFRASGIRVKRPTTAPSLVAMTTSQVPVIAWERRYMTIRECSRLQSMGDLEHLPKAQTAAFKALGNAVNVDVVKHLAISLLTLGSENTETVSSPPPEQVRPCCTTKEELLAAA